MIFVDFDDLLSRDLTLGYFAILKSPEGNFGFNFPIGLLPFAIASTEFLI